MEGKVPLRSDADQGGPSRRLTRGIHEAGILSSYPPGTRTQQLDASRMEALPDQGMEHLRPLQSDIWGKTTPKLVSLHQSKLTAFSASPTLLAISLGAIGDRMRVHRHALRLELRDKSERQG